MLRFYFLQIYTLPAIISKKEESKLFFYVELPNIARCL